MATVREYHRPVGLDEVLSLLARPDVTSIVLGGGTVVNADQSPRPVEVVDLQALGLDEIGDADGGVRIEAMVRLQDLVDSDALPALIREAARREAPNTIRNAATLGGTVASADADSGLVAALLVHGAQVEIATTKGPATIALADLVADRTVLAGGIVAAVVISPDGETAWAGTGRTPVDSPIVAAYARVHDGETSLALTGVAATPILVDPTDVPALAPPADFRGSSDYRRTLAAVLSQRVLDSLGVSP